MNLHSLKIYCAVVENGGFSKAAKELFISQPSVSAEIKTLEQKLGITLIKRRKSRHIALELTEAGQMVYDQAKHILKSIDKLYSSIDVLKEKELSTRQKTIIAANSPIGIFLLPQFISDFYDVVSHCKVETFVEVKYTALIQSLQNEVCDIGILPVEISVPNAKIHFTFEQELALVASSNYFQPDTFCSLNEIQLILTPKAFYNRKMLEQYFKREQISPNVVLESNHSEVIKNLLKLRKAATITHYVSVKDDIDQGELVRLTPPEKLPSVTYQVVTNTKSQLKEPSEQFIRHLKKSLLSESR